MVHWLRGAVKHTAGGGERGGQEGAAQLPRPHSGARGCVEGGYAPVKAPHGHETSRGREGEGCHGRGRGHAVPVHGRAKLEEAHK
jgi:hypothetical protein